MTSSTTLQIEHWPIERIQTFAANARHHPPEQIQQIAASIKEFGFNVPCMVDEAGVLIAGHGRLLAARKLGLEHIPVVSISHLSESQSRAFRIADNQIASNATWNLPTLGLEMTFLQEAGFDLSLLGLSPQELDKLLPGFAGIVEEDAIPAFADDAVSELGDLWHLDEHRLCCGDSTDPGAVAALLGKDKPHLMVTDPPYGVNYDPAWRNEVGASQTLRTGKVLNDDRADWRSAWELFPGDVAYVWHGALQSIVVAESLKASGFGLRAHIIWAKERLVLGRGDYHWQHEPCWYGVREKAKGHWAGDRSQTTLWSISSGAQDMETIHGTQKPVECMRRPMVNNSKPGDLIYDPFCGSGTTLIAAETAKRRCLTMELDPRYVDLAIRRWQSFTGQSAVHAANQCSFDELAVTKRPSL